MLGCLLVGYGTRHFVSAFYFVNRLPVYCTGNVTLFFVNRLPG